MDKKFYSNCCWAFMHDWPDSDICPECKEHCGGIEMVECIKCGRNEAHIDEDNPSILICEHCCESFELCKEAEKIHDTL